MNPGNLRSSKSAKIGSGLKVLRSDNLWSGVVPEVFSVLIFFLWAISQRREFCIGIAVASLRHCYAVHLVTCDPSSSSDPSDRWPEFLFLLEAELCQTTHSGHNNNQGINFDPKEIWEPCDHRSLFFKRSCIYLFLVARSRRVWNLKI